jgi:polar amino acid transport system substrate-binding protein
MPLNTNAIAPTGKLRVAIVVAAFPSPFFSSADAQGNPQGVTVDLAGALAAEVGIPLELTSYPNSGEITAAGLTGGWDVAFMPRDAERESKFDFGPPYFVARSTYLVPPHAAIKDIAEVNRPGVRIVAIAQTTTARSARRTAPLASVREVRSVDEWIELARTGEADAFALSHDALAGLLPKVPGARILSGEFQSVGVCIVVPRGRPAALSMVTAFIENAKVSGLVRRALDQAGFGHAAVAPSEANAPPADRL